MLVNVVDHRENKYNVNCDAVIESASHDNSISGSTQFSPDNGGIVEELYQTNVHEEINYANKFKSEVTLSLHTYNA